MEPYRIEGAHVDGEVGFDPDSYVCGHDADEAYPYLTVEDLDAALAYAAWRADEHKVMPAGGWSCFSI